MLDSLLIRRRIGDDDGSGGRTWVRFSVSCLNDCVNTVILSN